MGPVKKIIFRMYLSVCLPICSYVCGSSEIILVLFGGHPLIGLEGTEHTRLAAHQD